MLPLQALCLSHISSTTSTTSTTLPIFFPISLAKDCCIPWWLMYFSGVFYSHRLDMRNAVNRPSVEKNKTILTKGCSNGERWSLVIILIFGSAGWKNRRPELFCNLVGFCFCVCHKDGEMGSSSFVHIRGEECEKRAAMNDWSSSHPPSLFPPLHVVFMSVKCAHAQIHSYTPGVIHTSPGQTELCFSHHYDIIPNLLAHWLVSYHWVHLSV